MIVMVAERIFLVVKIQKKEFPAQKQSLPMLRNN